jgi:hypothetical protein
LLEYIRTRATALDAPRLRARVSSAAAELAAALAGLAERDARTAVRPGEWTVAQVVDHVAQSTVRAAEELRHLRAGRRPPGPPVYEALLSGAAHRVPWTELVEGLREASTALDTTLASAEHPGSGDPSAVTAPAVLVVSAPEAEARPTSSRPSSRGGVALVSSSTSSTTGRRSARSAPPSRPLPDRR